MFTRLSPHSAKTAKTSYGSGKPDSLPKCHNTLGYGIGSQARLLTADQQPTLLGIAADRPAVVECCGPDTVETIRTIKAQGGHIATMERLTGTNAGWRRRIHWPRRCPDTSAQEKPATVKRGANPSNVERTGKESLQNSIEQAKT